MKVIDDAIVMVTTVQWRTFELYLSSLIKARKQCHRPLLLIFREHPVLQMTHYLNLH